MTDIAHCTACGNPGVVANTSEHDYFCCCTGCGIRTYGSLTEESAREAWGKMLLADLAAQEHELWMRWNVTDLAIVRGCVRDRYDWLGQNPLSLPT